MECHAGSVASAHPTLGRLELDLVQYSHCSYSCIEFSSMERQLILSVGAVLLLLFTVASSQNCSNELEEADLTCFLTIGQRDPVGGLMVFRDCPTTNFTAVSLGNVRLSLQRL